MFLDNELLTLIRRSFKIVNSTKGKLWGMSSLHARWKYNSTGIKGRKLYHHTCSYFSIEQYDSGWNKLPRPVICCIGSLLLLIFTRVSHFSGSWSDNSRLGECSPRSEFMAIDEIIALPREKGKLYLYRIFEEDFFDRWTLGKFVTSICHSLFHFRISMCRQIGKVSMKWND